jgi:hypothetical protein
VTSAGAGSRRAARIPLVVALLLALATSFCGRERSSSPSLPTSNAVVHRSVSIYFQSTDMLLVPETRSLSLPANDASAIGAVVRELLKGSANPRLGRSLPSDTVLRGAFLLPEGTAIVDLGGPTLAQGWSTGSHEELLAVYSVVQTIASNFTSVKRVRILVNDEPAETLAGHISLERPLGPNASLLGSPNTKYVNRTSGL